MDERIKKNSKLIQFYDNIIENQKKGIKLSKTLKKSFLDLIKKIDFFNNMFSSYEDIKKMKFIDELIIKKYNKLNYIYHEDHKIPFIYILLNGNLRIEKQHNEIYENIKEFGYVLNYNSLNNMENTKESVFVFNDSYLIEIKYITYIEYNQKFKDIAL